MLVVLSMEDFLKLFSAAELLLDPVGVEGLVEIVLHEIIFDVGTHFASGNTPNVQQVPDRYIVGRDVLATRPAGEHE